MDKDTASVGALEHPLQPTKQLFYVSILMDAIGVLLSFIISGTFAVCIFIYITCSRLYSYRGIRLKQYPIAGYFTVIMNQGSLTFFMVYHGCDSNLTVHMPWIPLIAAAFLIGGFYPITQIYQHEQDRKDQVITLSILLGKIGTFIFCAAMYSLAIFLLWLFYNNHEQNKAFIVLIIFFVPVIIYFIRWFLQLLKSETIADFKHTMRMNWLASTCTSLAFITIILIQTFG